jgi:RND superfamily putative drug exporter
MNENQSLEVGDSVRETDETGVFWSWGHAMYRRRWIIIGLGLVLLIGFAIFAHKTPALLKDNGFTPHSSESEIGKSVLREGLEMPASSITVVYAANDKRQVASELRLQIMDSLEQVSRLPYVEDVRFVKAARLHNDEHVQAVSISLNLDTDDALQQYSELRSLVGSSEGMAVYITGGTPILYDMQQASRHDIVKAEMIGLPIALIVLFAVFGTVIGALLPLIVGLMSVTLTLGITYFIALDYPLSNFLPNMVTMLGLAVGIDYALFMVSRFREELKRQPAVSDAVAMTCQRAGKSIFFSGIAVLIGLCGMLFIDLTIFRSLWLGGVLVVACSAIVANTLLLSLLGVLGHKINMLKVVPDRWNYAVRSRVWEKVAYVVMKKPIWLVLAVSIPLIYFTLPITGMKLGVPSAEVLPPSYESRHGADILEQTFDQRQLEPLHIAITAQQSVWEEETVRQMHDYVRRVEQLPGVQAVTSYVDALGLPSVEHTIAALKQEETRRRLEDSMLAKGSTALVVVEPASHPRSAQTEALVRELRSLPADGLRTSVTGAPAYRVDIVDRINEQIPIVVSFVMIVTYVVLMFAFRSIVLPLKAVAMNVLSLGASLGIVVSVVQHGYLAEWLNITSIGNVNATLPVIIFCVVFGISMDYEVFMLSRIVEEYEATGDNELSTAVGLKKTAGLITSAALILIVVVGSFLMTDIEIMKALGLGLALSVFIDATVIRIALVPALMKWMGKANWWAPNWLKRKEA